MAGSWRRGSRRRGESVGEGRGRFNAETPGAREGCPQGWGRPRGGGDDGEELKLGDGSAGDVEALGVGAGVGWGEEEAGVVDQGVEQGAVGGGEAFELVSRAEGDAEPEALGAGAGEEGAASKALGVDGVGEVEVADVADGLDVAEGQGEDAAAQVEEIDRVIADEGDVGQVAGECVPGETPDDDFLTRVGHGVFPSGRLSHGAKVASRKRCEYAG